MNIYFVGKKGRKSELNTTFDKDTSAKEDTLNVTFDKDEEEPSVKMNKRRSSAKKLSIGNIQSSSLAKETENSPALRRQSSVKTPVVVKTPVRVSTGQRVSSVKKNRRVSEVKNSLHRVATPRTSSGGKIVKPTSRVSTPRRVSNVGVMSAKKPTPSISTKKTIPGTNIPRFVKYARKVPDFSKIHEKQMNKMESLDQYLDKKKKRFENSVEDQRVSKCFTCSKAFLQ